MRASDDRYAVVEAGSDESDRSAPARAERIPNGQRRPGSRILKYWRLAGALTGAALAVSALIVRFNALAIAYPPVTLDFPIMMVERIKATAAFGGAERPRVLMIGDSTVFAGAPPKGALPDRLFEELQRKMPAPPMVMSLATHGASIFDYYPLTERIALTRPVAVVFGFSLATISKEFRDRMTRRETYGWLGSHGVAAAARGPIYYWGLTFDALLLYKSFVQLGLTQTWLAVRREQARSGSGLDALRKRLQDDAPAFLTGEEQAIPLFADIPRTTAPRASKARLEHIYSPALYGIGPRSPLLAFYDRTLAIFERAGVPVLVYVVPANVEHMRRVGITDTDGLTRTARSICAVAENHHDVCLDLHEELPDPWFADAAGHFTTLPERDGMRRVAQALVPAMLDLLATHAGRNTPGAGASRDADSGS